MRLIDAITDPGVARRILECLALPGRAAPLAPASELDLGSTIGGRDCDAASAEADSDPDFDFDQSADDGPDLERRIPRVRSRGEREGLPNERHCWASGVQPCVGGRESSKSPRRRTRPQTVG